MYRALAALLLVSLTVVTKAQMLQMPMQIRPIEKIISQPLLISEYMALKASGGILKDENITETIMGGGMSITGSYFVEVKIAGNPFRLVVVNILNTITNLLIIIQTIFKPFLLRKNNNCKYFRTRAAPQCS